MSAFNKGDKIFAQDIQNLKAEVKAELSRRNQTGDLSSYSSSSYDFETVPIQNIKIEREHYDKIRTPLAAINTENLPEETPNAYPSLTTLNARLTLNKSQTGKSATTHGCMSSCSGLCYNSCTSCSGCSGCSGCGGCDGTCWGCSGSCLYTCSGCSNTCTGSCSGGCSGCGGACTNNCTGSCSACGGAKYYSPY